MNIRLDIKKRLEKYFDGCDRLQYYGIFLNEGDFEYWMPCCFIDKTSQEWNKKKSEADLLDINSTKSKTEKIRTVWIKNRFTEYDGEKWNRYHKFFNELLLEIDPEFYNELNR